MTVAVREDLLLAAYAVSLGYSIEAGPNGFKFDPTGIPHEGLQFTRGDVHVWDTARGWRCSRLGDDGRFPHPPPPGEFYQRLLGALTAGVKIGPAAPRYTCEAGRAIYRNGRPLFTIEKCRGVPAEECDRIARRVAVLLDSYP